MDFTIGTDIEGFLSEKKTGLFTSAIPVIPGTKESPVKLPSGGLLSYDNVACEFATPVATNEQEFVDMVKTTLKETVAMIPRNLRLNLTASALFPEKELEHPVAKIFGCDKDYNVWLKRANPKPKCPDLPTLRTAGLHVHVGAECIKKGHASLDAQIAFTRMLDINLGISSVLLDNSKMSVQRRLLYGKSGAFRPKPYGIEYRTLSNFWLKSKNLVSLIYKFTRDTMNLFSNEIYGLLDDVSGNIVQETINGNDVETARIIFDKYISKNLADDTTSLFELVERSENFNPEAEWELAA